MKMCSKTGLGLLFRGGSFFRKVWLTLEAVGKIPELAYFVLRISFSFFYAIRNTKS